MKQATFLILLMLSVTGCDYLRTVGQGLSNAKDEISQSVACVSVGLYPCLIVAGVTGYAEGKENTRDKIRLENQTDKNDDCWWSW